MKDTLKALIATAVEKNLVFSGAVGTAYTIQDLIHVANLQTINKMFQATKKELGSLETDSLFKTANTAKSRDLSLKTDILREVFEYKQDLADAAQKAAEERAKRAERLAALRNLASAKELEELGKMSLEDINAEIARAEA